ncbi:hypothetical protein FACS189460_4810 [Deltaproteobacteria bacterium]|nr:hypothetical protein FACS189460_4810 [Deltaproteobacteria bacterium]
MPPKFLVFLIILLLNSPAALAQNFAVQAIDYAQWPEVRLIVQLPGDREKMEHYTLNLSAESQPLNAAGLTGPRNLKEPLSLVVALDTSPSLRKADFEAAKGALVDYVAQLEPDERVALLAFNDHVQALTGFTTDTARLTSALKELSPAGAKTELYKAMNFGLDLLKEAPGRRLLLVVSDGWDEGRDSTSWQVLKNAQEYKIQINAIGLPGNSPESDNHLTIMENFAKDTGGLYHKADSAGSLALAVYELFKSQRLARVDGYQYELKFVLPQDLPGGEPTLNATLTRRIGDSGQTLNITLTPPQAAPKPPSETKPSAEDESAADSEATPPESAGEPWWASLAKQPWWVWAIAAAVALLIILAVVLTRQKSVPANKAMVALDIPLNRQTVAAPLNRHTVADPSPRQSSPFVLELTELGLRFPLYPGAATLGASPGNDFQVDIPTVSGKHAEFQVTLTECRVKDLHSTNGTQVNGRNISQWTILKNGDGLTFGSARAMLRFNR